MLLMITLEFMKILQTISRRVVGNVLNNISLSISSPTLPFPAKCYQNCQAAFGRYKFQWLPPVLWRFYSGQF